MTSPEFKLNDRIQQFFNERADGWDEMVCPEHPLRLADLIERLHMSAGATVLDVGTGTGVLVPLLARQVGDRGTIVAVDIAFRMLLQVRSRCASRDCVLVAQADALTLPVACRAFDWVMCNSCFPHFEQQAAAVAEFARVLKPGGSLVICHTQSRKVINDHHAKVGGIVGGHELPDEADMRSMVQAAGLAVQELEDQEQGYLMRATAPR